MSAHASSSGAPPPLPPPTHPLTNPHGNPPTSISPTLPSSSSSTHSPSISMTSPSIHSPETARQIAEARAALEASMTNIGSSLDTTLRSRAQDLHSNSKQLEKQQKDVVKATEALRKESDKLKKVADEGMKRVKELGNVQNWAEMLERDFLVLGETLRLVERGSESEGSSYTGSEWETSSEGSRDEECGREPAIGLEGGGEGKSMERDAGSMGDAPPLETPNQTNVDADGDTQMDGTESEVRDKGKGKAVEVVSDTLTEDQVAPMAGGSSTATATNGSTSDPSSSSIHTAASAAS
ncbi:hypothetical protein ONS95_007099 [Cadophora gregata]|uniref:uncharacterized protein n=1 Tax=Cadophora gregata TaxID=51156 RepID=UPI0026DAB5E4|nr:uncharacterized protein ONS95_007099 [Cadophora gregata]KAK0100646.1 hypothetical protein ONS95_007099 [Cadophora gregata]